MTNTKTDVIVRGGGTLYSFIILSARAKAWVQENVDRSGYNPDFPNTIFVEHRCAADLAQGLQRAGLVVR